YDGSSVEEARLWTRLGEQFLLGLHIPEEDGGEGFGLAESAIVLEELGRSLAGAGAAATIAVTQALVQHASDEVRQRFLPGLASGATRVGLGLTPSLAVQERAVA